MEGVRASPRELTERSERSLRVVPECSPCLSYYFRLYYFWFCVAFCLFRLTSVTAQRLYLDTTVLFTPALHFLHLQGVCAQDGRRTRVFDPCRPLSARSWWAPAATALRHVCALASDTYQLWQTNFVERHRRFAASLDGARPQTAA